MKQALEEPCIICDKKTMHGIRLYSKMICVECESEMIHTDVKDEKYPFFIHQLRRIWYQKDA